MNISELSTDQIAEILAERQKKERKDRDKAAKKYVADRDKLIEELSNEAHELALAMGRFKTKVHACMDVQAKKLEQYGKLRGNSKGGFAITDSDGQFRVVRRRDTDPVWDERAGKGVDLIKSFLGDTIKKRDMDLYEILIKFLEKNDNGDLEYAKVFSLMEHESKFDDPRWIEGLKLVKESFSISLKCFGYEFKRKNAQGKFETMVLNFSSL